MQNGNILKSVLKPARYSGGEYGEVKKDKSLIDARWAFCFPDTYEIGMSNLGMRLLYGALNEEENIWCERVFAPWTDMEEKLRTYNLPLCAIESGDALIDFDIIGFTLQYEMCYTNVLNMMKLAKLPLYAAQRDDDMPVIIGGGPCAYNAEPMADFFDCFSIGEGEEMLVEFTKLYIAYKKDKAARGEKFDKSEFLHKAAAEVEGCYVPSLYEVSYNEDGTVREYKPMYNDIPERVKKRIISDLDKSYFPDKLILPYIETVHDRIMLEVFRGCIRGCRFCQSGMICRPVREKSPEVLDRQARALYKSSGFEEISMTALSISDYSKLPELTDRLLSWTNEKMVNLSLPSLRIDSFSEELMKKVASVRSSSLTFAPEAGTQRLRDVINKNVSEEDLMRSVETAFRGGKNNVKLYFMNGLPTETYEDIEGIATLASAVIGKFYATPDRNRAKPPSVTVSVSCFIPKPFTPFQWEAQDSLEVLRDKQKFLATKITDRKVRYDYHDACVSRIEAALARGDRKISAALALCAERGFHFDAWDEYFNYGEWVKAFEDAGVDIGFYANRRFGNDEVLPWEVIDPGVDREFLLREQKKAYEVKTTPSCAEKCSGCGILKLKEADDAGCDKYRYCPKIDADNEPKATTPIEAFSDIADFSEYPPLDIPKAIRVFFVKTGAAKYMSHLDLQRTMTHVLVRSRLPLWYTQGFNPHIKMVFSAPLPLGSESLCEYLDIRLTRDVPFGVVMNALNEQLTDEMTVKRVEEPQFKSTDIKTALYEYEIKTKGAGEALAAKIRAALSSPPLIIKKHTKSGDKEVDIFPGIASFSVGFVYGDEKSAAKIKISARLAAEDGNYLNPEAIITVLKEKTGILSGNPLEEEYNILRTEFGF